MDLFEIHSVNSCGEEIFKIGVRVLRYTRNLEGLMARAAAASATECAPSLVVRLCSGGGLFEAFVFTAADDDGECNHRVRYENKSDRGFDVMEKIFVLTDSSLSGPALFRV
jgi:hypothetical protein